MKKIYMFLAAITLLSMSLNAQRLPANMPGGLNFNPNGTATLVNHNTGQLRMPSLGTDEYLLGPYTTDAFDATGIGYSGYYNAAQQITTTVQLDRSDWESHLGDTIIGFRFALAGSTATRVYDFQALPFGGSTWDTQNQHIWSLGDLMSGNATSTTQTVTAHNAITIYISNGNLSFQRIAVEKLDGTTVTEWTYEANVTNLPNNNWSTTSSFLNTDTPCWMSGGGTITISANELTGVTEPVRVVIYGKTYNSYYNSSSVTVNGSLSQSITNYSTWQNYTFGPINPTTQTVNVNTVEVGRGSTKHEHLPVSGYNQDYGYQNQMIYRAGQLCMASGATITSLTFYPEPNQGIPFSGSSVVVKLANITADNFGTGDTGNKITDGLTTVATIEPVADHDATAWTINFSTPFTYTGGNLLVQMECPGAGKYGRAYFLGDDQSANVSLTAVGRSGISSSTGNTSTFLPKATFTFTGNINDPEYLTLAGGEWHDFFLNEPVVFNVMSDDINELLIGYTYYQENSTSHTPTAVNSSSTGHTHLSYMYARSNSSSTYQQAWWNDGVSGSSNTDRPGDLAVQLIFKKAKEKTPTPEITYTYDNGYYYITATATGDNAENAEVTLTVNGTTVTGTGNVTVNLGRGAEDYDVIAVATAIEPDKLVSDVADADITILASELDPSPNPSFTSEVLDLTVQVTGSGEGDVHMYVTWPDGTTREVSYPNYYLERGAEDYTVTVTITNQTENHYMTSYTGTVLVPKLENLDELIDGWEVLPGTYTNDKVITWNDNLMFVDRFTASTANNNQPSKYIYKMTEDDRKIGTPRSTNEHIIPVQLTRSKVNGYYTEQEVIDDTDRKHVDIDVMNADVEMFLEKTPDIYYYTLDRSRTSIEDDNFLQLSNLQNDGSRYVEMGNYFQPKYQAYEIGETGIMLHRFDTFNDVLPESAPQGVDNKHYGAYGQDYMAYVPIIWTFGNLDVNKRAFWDRDHVHNSYGSPIWKTGVGQVINLGADAEPQKGWNTTWKNGDENCRLYMLDNVTADGYLPNALVTNIEYEPYMFRIFVESKNGKLRHFDYVTNEDGNKVITAVDGDTNGPWCVWSEYITLDENGNIVEDATTQANGVSFQQTGNVITFKKEKVERTATPEATEENPNPATPAWDKDKENAIFGAVDALANENEMIDADDLTVYVRFYYRSTGKAIETNRFMLRADGEQTPEYYAAEGGARAKQVPTGVNEIRYHGEVVSTTYYNIQGIESDKPFDGVNIVITRYSDGATSVSKIVR